jgi:PhnB protein
MNAKLSPYLNFTGQTKEAMEFYQSILGGELKLQTYKEAGFPHDPKDDDKVIHADLQNDTLSFMASDGDDEHPVHMGDNIHMSIMGTDESELRGFFEKLSEGGKVDMPLVKQFWGDIYGQLTDKFGVHWVVNISSDEQK